MTAAQRETAKILSALAGVSVSPIFVEGAGRFSCLVGGGVLRFSLGDFLDPVRFAKIAGLPGPLPKRWKEVATHAAAGATRL